jgi:hypothetical protein
MSGFICVFLALIFIIQWLSGDSYKWGILKANLIEPERRVKIGIIKIATLIFFFEGIAYIKYRKRKFSKFYYELYCKEMTRLYFPHPWIMPANVKYLKKNGINDFEIEAYNFYKKVIKGGKENDGGNDFRFI